MNITINGEVNILPGPLLLSELLQHYGYPASGIALAVNQNVIPRHSWADYLIQEGDHLDIFQVIAGG